MDQQKIGKFIAQQRKKKGLTQSQLAEKLMLSEKTISKWECGKGLPEVSLMMPLCEILEITVNELLSGESLSQEEYKKQAESNLVEHIKKSNRDNKQKLIASFIIAISVSIILAMSVFLANIVEELYIKILLLVFSLAFLVLGVAYACILDLQVGFFECPHCHHRYTPTLRAYVFGTHTIKKRHMKCPKCGKWGWHKHEISDKKNGDL